MVKFTKTKPRKGPNAKQMITNINSVEMKQNCKKKECITASIKKKPKSAKEKKKEQRRDEQNDFLLFLEQNNKE